MSNDHAATAAAQSSPAISRRRPSRSRCSTRGSPMRRATSRTIPTRWHSRRSMHAGHPNVRMVLLKAVDPARHPARGFVFFTNYESAKGRELSAAPYAALDFHWKSLHRQVRVRGPVTPTTAAEADAYFATRPRSAQIGAWASQQSRPLESRFALEKAVRARGGQIPRRHGAAAAVLVGLSRHAARDRVLAQPLVAAARAHRLQARGGRRRLAQNAALSIVP